MSYRLITLTSNESLSWAYPFTGGVTAADYNNVSANADGYVLTLPPANLVPTGQSVLFNNIGKSSFIIAEFGTIETVATLTAGQVVEIYLTDSSTASGSWQPIPFGAGMNGITAITVESSDNSIIITDGAIIPPGGIIDFRLSESLTNLNDLTSIATPGFPIIIDNLPLQWTTRSLVAGANIDIANPDGVADNPVISLQSSLSGLTDVSVSDAASNSSVISGTGIIITDSANGNSTNISATSIKTAGSTPLNINGVTIDTSGNISNVTSLNIGSITGSAVAAAWCCFSDTGSGCTSAIVMGNSYNVATVTGAAGVYTITFGNPLASATYAVLTSLQRGTSTLLPFQTFIQVKNTTYLTIACVDTLGNLLPPTDGVSIVVFLNPS